MTRAHRRPWTVWTEWRPALVAALPALAASLLFAGPLTGLVRVDMPTLGRALLGAIVAGLAGAAAARRWGWPGRLGWLTVAVALGVVAPLATVQADLAARALGDPDRIVVAPALATLAGLAVATGAGLALAPLAEPAPAGLAAHLFPLAGLTVWLHLLSWRADERTIWAALTFTFALAALVAFAATLLTGWRAHLPALLALALAWALALGLARPGLPATRPAEWLALGQFALAAGASLLAVGVPLAVAGWRRWRGSRLPIARRATRGASEHQLA